MLRAGSQPTARKPGSLASSAPRPARIRTTGSRVLPATRCGPGTSRSASDGGSRTELSRPNKCSELTVDAGKPGARPVISYVRPMARISSQPSSSFGRWLTVKVVFSAGSEATRRTAAASGLCPGAKCNDTAVEVEPVLLITLSANGFAPLYRPCLCSTDLSDFPTASSPCEEDMPVMEVSIRRYLKLYLPPMLCPDLCKVQAQPVSIA